MKLEVLLVKRSIKCDHIIFTKLYIYVKLIVECIFLHRYLTTKCDFAPVYESWGAQVGHHSIKRLFGILDSDWSIMAYNFSFNFVKY